MNNKTTKRALFLSFVSMFLCFTMLIGTTYAWFTDEVTSGVNQIVAGNLDVELTHTNDKVNDADVQDSTELFKLDKWEPGAMAWENFTVKNAGDLALKYQFVLEGEAVGEKDLRNVIKVAVLDRAIDPTTDTRDTLKSETFVGFDELAPKAGEIKKDAASQEQTFGVVLYWAPSANDNDYNMNNGNLGKELSINVFVKLYATQLEAENDSFGPDYDKDAVVVAKSNTVPLPAAGETATEDKTLTTSIEDNVTLTLSDEFLNALAAATNAPSEVALSHAEPKFDKDNGTVTFDHIELVDENGEIIDLETLGNDKPITVKFNVGDAFDAGDTVRIYHDGEFVTEETVDAEKNVTYTTTHFCEVIVSDRVCVSTEAELKDAVAAGKNIIFDADFSLSEILVINKPIVLDGNGKTLTSSAGRAINVSGADGVTIKNLTINCTGERAINVIQKATNITVENVTATADNYTVNVASSAPNAVVAIKDSEITGLCAINVAASNSDVTVENSKIVCDDQNTTTGESYAALTLNKDAIGAKLTANDCEIIVAEGSDSYKAKNGADGATLTIDGSDKDVYMIYACIDYPAYNSYYGFATLAEAISFAKDGETVTLLRDIVLTETVTVPADKSLVIDLGGHDITTEAQFAIKNEGNLTIKGDGTVSAPYAAYYSTGVTTIEGGSFESSNGFGAIFDNIYGTDPSVATINGGTFTGVGIYNPTEVTINGGIFNVGRDPDGASDIISDNMTLFICPTFDGVTNTAVVTLTGGTFNGDVYVYDDGITETTFVNNGATITGEILDNA